MTPRYLITRALKKSGVNGVGQTPSPDDLQDALDDLNDMFGQWQRRRWLVTDLIEVVFSSVGKQFYTVGPAVTCDIVMQRPDQLADAFLRLSPNSLMPIDYKIDVLSSREDYNEITLKAQAGLTSAMYYDPGLPYGTLYVWPTPPGNGSTEFHLFFKSQEFLTLGLDDNINLPPEYSEALLYNLAARLRPSYQLGPDPSIIALASSALTTIRKANVQIPETNMPSNLPGRMMRGGSAAYGLGYAGGAIGSGNAGVFRVDISMLDGSDGLGSGLSGVISSSPIVMLPSSGLGGSTGSGGSSGTNNFRVDVSALDGMDVLL